MKPGKIEDRIAMAIATTISAKYGTKHWCELWDVSEDELREFLDFGKSAMGGFREMDEYYNSLANNIK